MCSWGDSSSQLGNLICESVGQYAPRLDLRPSGKISGRDVIASRTVPRVDGLGAALVGVRGDADEEWRSWPNTVAVHKGVVLLDVSLHEGKVGLDGVTIEYIESVSKLAVCGP